MFNLKHLYQRIPIVNRFPTSAMALGAALLLIAAGLGAVGVISGQAPTEVKQTITVGSANAAIPASSTAATTTAFAAVAGNTTLKVVNVAGFKVNDVLSIDQGVDVEFRTVTGVTGFFATGTLTFAAAVADGETVTIDSGSNVRGYTFKTTVAGLTALTTSETSTKVAIGGSFSASRDNLLAAINGAAGAGESYQTGTLPHPTVSAAVVKDSGATIKLVLTAKTAGDGGNSIATLETLAGTDNAWAAGATTLTGGLGGTQPTLTFAPLATKHAPGVPVAATLFSVASGIVTDNKTRFLSSFAISQGETGRIQFALENNSNQKAAARIDVSGLPPGTLMSATPLVTDVITAVIRLGPTTYLLEIVGNTVGVTPNVEVDVIAGDTTLPGFYPVEVQIVQIAN